MFERVLDVLPYEGEQVERAKTGVVLHMEYHEIDHVDITAIIAKIFDKGKLVKVFSNFCLEEYMEEDAQEVWGNQSDVFFLPTVDIAISMFETASGYDEEQVATLEKWYNKGVLDQIRELAYNMDVSLTADEVDEVYDFIRSDDVEYDNEEDAIREAIFAMKPE